MAVVASSSSSFHSVVITAEGQTYAWGRADKGQVGTGEALPKPIMEPTLLKALQVLTIDFERLKALLMRMFKNVVRSDSDASKNFEQ